MFKVGDRVMFDEAKNEEDRRLINRLKELLCLKIDPKFIVTEVYQDQPYLERYENEFIKVVDVEFNSEIGFIKSSIFKKDTKQIEDISSEACKKIYEKYKR